MKKALLFGLLILAVVAALLWLLPRRVNRPKLIGIVQFVHHPLLDETHRGILAELGTLGLNDGKRFLARTHVADRSYDLSAQITRQFLADDAALIIAIATPSAQAAAAQTSRTPIVFAAITDPVAAKLVQTLERPGRNLTGTSNRWPFDRQIGLIPKLLPQAKTIGAVWNPGEANSQAAMEAIRPLLAKQSHQLVEAPVATTADVAPAARNIARKVHVFLMIPDNTTLAATNILVQVCADTKKPLIGGDIDTVRRGSLATYGYDYFELGQVTARMAKEIVIDAKAPSLMPVRYPPTTSLVLNQTSAQRFGVAFPQDLVAQATEVVR